MTADRPTAACNQATSTLSSIECHRA